MKYAILGAGRIAPVYLELASHFPGIACAGVADHSAHNARDVAARFGVPARTFVELAADPEVDAIVNLTPIPVHAEVSDRILAAGKHLYSEKPLANRLADARKLRDRAASRGLMLAVAPDTFLGAAGQKARELIDSGAIGRPIGANAQFMMDGARFGSGFMSAAVGPVREIGPYYLTALVHLLGPVRAIASASRTHVAERPLAEDGTLVPVEAVTSCTALLDFASDVQATIRISVDGTANTQAPLEIYGTKGSLILPDPNFFGGPIELVLRSGERQAFDTSQHPLGRLNWQDGTLANYRGVGLADMADALATRRAPRASAEVAVHVAEIIECLATPSSQSAFHTLETSCDRPDPLSEKDAAHLTKAGQAGGAA